MTMKGVEEARSVVGGLASVRVRRKGKVSSLSMSSSGGDEEASTGEDEGKKGRIVGAVANVADGQEEFDAQALREARGCWQGPEDLEDDERDEMEENVGRFFRIKSGVELEAGKKGESALSGTSSSGGDQGTMQTRGRRSRRTRGPGKVAKSSPKSKTSVNGMAISGRMEEIPFWNVDHRKLVPIELRRGDAKDDLALMQGRNSKAKVQKQTARGSREAPSGQWLRHPAGYLLCTRCSSALWPPHGRHHLKVCRVRD
mmetsp:Transcript_13497/g.27577  ORF Transcript_13497/g.27577 Transcript_13497/m.27577 type:complete len:257 (-) Transcript_13497:978-1748(-)